MKYQPGDLVIFDEHALWFVVSTNDGKLIKHALFVTMFSEREETRRENMKYGKQFNELAKDCRINTEENLTKLFSR